MSQSTQPPVQLDGVDPNQERLIEEAIEAVRVLRDTNPVDEGDFDARITAARRIITSLDSSTFINDRNRYEEQIYVIGELQNLAYYKMDSGGIQDIAQWCLTRYLSVFTQSTTEHTEVLFGLGKAWLFRAQSTLARIHSLEGSPSSGTSSGRPSSSAGRMSYTSSEDAREVERALVEADIRAGTADYVEARGMLLPATEYLNRAVRAAEVRTQLSGELLSIAAEAQMSLGNVSYSHHSEQYFRQAVLYLQMASRIVGFRLSPYLQNYLDDFGRLVQ